MIDYTAKTKTNGTSEDLAVRQFPLLGFNMSPKRLSSVQVCSLLCMDGYPA
jgi:hypothetical protein